MIVEPAHGLRHPIHHVEISLRVEMPENFVCVVERIDMKHFTGSARLCEGFLQRLGGTAVPRTGRGRQNEDFVDHYAMRIGF